MKKTPSVRHIFLAFFQLSASAFGGALPWARVILVERKKWLNEEEFIELLSFCQILPGPNIVNLSVAFGQRCHGVRGALAGAFGLLSLPFLLTLGLGMGFSHFSSSHALKGVLSGVIAAATGLLIATTFKLLQNIFKSDPSLIFFSVLAFLVVAIGHLHLVLAICILAPLSIRWVFWRRS